MRIGDWIRREHRWIWHHVESIVAGDAVTRCGRRLTDQPTTRGGLVIFVPGRDMGEAPGARCKGCSR